MLRYQLNPHFLFNTLNSISTLVLLKQTERANAMLSRLSSFLRYTLVNEPTAKVTLVQEVETLKLYLEIEKMRFEDRLRPHFKIDGDTIGARLPSLLLQPLIENLLHLRKILKTSLSDLDLSVRAYNCLKAADIKNLADLVSYDIADLLKFRNFGKKSLSELEELVRDKGLTFGMDLSKYKLNED